MTNTDVVEIDEPPTASAGITHIPLPAGATVETDWDDTYNEYRIIAGHTWEVPPANELPIGIDPRTFLVKPYATQQADGTFHVSHRNHLPLVCVDEVLNDATPAGATPQDCLALTAPVARKLASALVAAADQLDGWISGSTANAVGQRPAGGRARNDYFTDEFLTALDKFCQLPEDRYGEWYDVVQSSWIGGIKPSWRSGGQDDPNATVALSRAANNEPEYGAPIVEHEVRLDLTKASLYMCPESAISLGHHLIAAGTAAMRDLARHAAWLLPATQAVPADGS